MRVLVVVPRLSGGGAEFVAAEWIKHLSAAGHRVTVCTTNSTERPAQLPAAARHHSLGRPASRLSQVRLLRRVIRTERPEVCLSLQAHPNLVLLMTALVAGASRPGIVVSERNLVSPGLRGAPLAHRRKIWLTKLLYRTADHMVAISHPVAAEMISAFGVRQDRCTVVRNPAMAKVRAAVRAGGRDRGLASALTLVLPCRLVEQKRPLVTVEVAEELRSRGVETELLVFGGGPLEADLAAAADRAGVACTFAGWDQHWFDHCPPGSVVLLPSLREGFGNVLVEAAGVSVPAVAVGMALGVADAVVPGITGELADRMTADALADAVIRARDCSFEGADSWLRHFEASASGEALERVLVEVAR